MTKLKKLPKYNFWKALGSQAIQNITERIDEGYKKFFKKGWKILDTHVGSASSLIAYEILGFEYVGYEKDKDHFLDSSKRIKEYRQQMQLNF